MSYSYLIGIVPVSEGRKVQTVRSTGSAVWHAVYDSMLSLESGEVMEGTFRAFSPASESIYPSDSLMFVNCKFAIPPGTADKVGVVGPMEFVLESISHTAFVADPQEDGYDSFVPVNNVPIISLLGNVVGSVVHLGDGGKAIDVRVSNYIQGKTMDCVYRCRFPATARWSKVNMPVAGSVISVIGRPHSCTGFSGSGMLMITIEDIVYNPGTAHILDEARGDSAKAGRHRVRKRKLAALDALNCKGDREDKVGNEVNGDSKESASGESGPTGGVNQVEDSANCAEPIVKDVVQIEAAKKIRSSKKSVLKSPTAVAKTRANLKKKEVEQDMDGELTDIDEVSNNVLEISG